MIDLSITENQILQVANFRDLVETPFQGKTNAICWTRKLTGDFSEIVKKIEINGNIVVVQEDELLQLHLSDQGQLALITQVKLQ